MKKKLIWSLAVGILLSSVTLYLAFRNVPFKELIAYLGAINYAWVLPSVVLVALTFFLRALRWQIILNTSERIGFWQSYHPLMIGFMLNCILPGRVGEAARPLILNRKKGVPFTKGLATVVTERLLDAGFLIVFLALALATIPMDTTADVAFGKYQLNKETLRTLGVNFVYLCIVLLIGTLLVAFDKTRGVLNKCIVNTPDILLFFGAPSFRDKIRQTIFARIARLVDHAAEGLSLIKHPRKMGFCVGVTLLIWFLAILSYYAMALGCPGVELTFYEFGIVLVVICFFIALPSVPGYWGVWEAGGVFALTLFGVSSQTAASFTLASHAVQIFPVILMGLVSAASISVNIWQISYSRQPG